MTGIGWDRIAIGSLEEQNSPLIIKQVNIMNPKAKYLQKEMEKNLNFFKNDTKMKVSSYQSGGVGYGRPFGH